MNDAQGVNYGPPPPPVNRVLQTLDTIAAAPIDWLRLPASVAALVRNMGVEGDPRALGDAEQENAVPTGTGLFQLPDQLAPFLVDLSHRKIRTYLEVGTWSGKCAAFVTAYLRRFNSTLQALTIDPNPRLCPEWDEITRRLPLRHECNISHDFHGRSFDLVFIDADHDLNAVRADFFYVGCYAKICAFHDIQDRWISTHCQDGGVPVFWKEMVKSYTVDGRNFTKEYRSHPTNLPIMGIGVIDLEAFYEHQRAKAAIAGDAGAGAGHATGES